MRIVDQAYVKLSTKKPFFSQGWGDLSEVQNFTNPSYFLNINPKIRLHIEKTTQHLDHQTIEAYFRSPMKHDFFPKESKIAHVKFVLPLGATKETPVCLHLASTGDQGYKRRYNWMAKPLIKMGIGSVILENPYYGIRKPKHQVGVFLDSVTDLILMGSAAVIEAKSILLWLKEQKYKNIGITGISMGGSLSAIAGSLVDFPVAISSCLPSHSPSAVFTEGEMRKVCAWDKLSENQSEDPMNYFSNLVQFCDISKLPRPQNPKSAILLAAKSDAFIPTNSVYQISKSWPGSELRWVKGGHVTSVMFRRGEFHQAIKDSFLRL